MQSEATVRDMRDAETYLSIVQDRGRRRLPLERVYRRLFDRGLFLAAYGKIATNAGAMTPGTTEETVDGMSLAKIEEIIELLKHERYRFAPARRVYIEKKNSTKKRPLGVPTFTDKLVQEVVRTILEAYYEPRFSDRSHGFRAERGCHTALQEIQRTWTGTVWFIEGDIKGCFDNLDHGVLLDTLKRDIHDGRFIALVKGMLDAGYMEDWVYHKTLSGSSQGGIVSPILSNIYLHALDEWIETTLIPEHTRGTRRKANPNYERIQSRHKRASKTGENEKARTLRKQMRMTPSKDPNDPDYRRLRYVRYADDFLLGYTGTRMEAEEIKARIGTFLRDRLNLELSEEKTLITHGRTESARFLGYDLEVRQADDRITRMRDGRRMRMLSGKIGLRVPKHIGQEKADAYMRNGKPIARAERLNDSDYSIVVGYALEYRGIVQYYRMAYNLARLNTLRWVMETSLTKTLAHKHQVSTSEIWRRHRTTIETKRGPRKVLQVRVERAGKVPLVATWGNVSLARDANATIHDDPTTIRNRRTELVERLLADTCERCGSREDIQVHHIRALKDLNKPGRREKPEWMKQMAAKRRKTLVVCRACHHDIHHGPPKRSMNTPPTTGEPDDAKVSRPVRRGADGKGA
jgi:group II intron reverse transcriptase/maturase